MNWKYPSPYDLYNMNGDPDNLSELMNKTYYAVENDEHKLIGFYCYGKSATVPIGNDFKVYSDNTYLDIGIGLRPDLCGKGEGTSFFCHAITFSKKQFGAHKLRLTVTTFNKRAIKLYKALGFQPSAKFNRITEQGETNFITMLYSDYENQE